MNRQVSRIGLIVALVSSGAARAADAPREDTLAANVRAAEKLVNSSDRYLHHDKLQRGMTGYGLTVMAGTKIEKFQATVVSVLRNWYPRQDVILCKLSGLDLEKSGIIAGMSGSPVYITDPADGKAKLIGAVAYGWNFQNEPICGVQPIVQMLAIRGVVGEAPAVAATESAPGTGELDPGFVRAVLNPRKVSFATFAVPRRAEAAGGRDRPRLMPLATPLMISGGRPETVARTEKLLAGTGLVAMQAGSVAAAQAPKAGEIKLEPGSGIAIPLASGDADWAAVGTVTDVIGEKVLAFGHSFFAAGDVEMPMGPAYIHTVISSNYTSFKLGAGLPAVGALIGDQYTGVFGKVGQTARTVPMSITVKWGDEVKKYQYQLIRHRWYTAVMASSMFAESLYADRDLPEQHTLTYSVNIDFGKLGRYAAANVSSATGDYGADSDLTRPLAALPNTGLGPPVWPEKIDMTVTVEDAQKTAEIQGLKLHRNVYRPGQTVRGAATLRPFRAERVTRDVSVNLPADLPDGTYTLTVCGADDAQSIRQREAPHRYDPRTVEQLLESMCCVCGVRADRMYVHLPVGKGGLAVRKQEMDRMPASLAEVLSRTSPMDTADFERSILLDVPIEWVVTGSAQATFEVKKELRP